MNKTKSRLVTVHNNDWIAPLSMYGPIVSPRYYNEELVKKLVFKGYTVREYPTPIMKSAVKYITLTTKNFDDPQRFNPNNEDITPTELKTAFTGIPASGTAKAVNPIAADAPVPTPTTEIDHNASPVETPAAVVIPNGLSKNERKKLARQQREAEAAARAAKAAEEAAKAEAQEKVEETVTEETETNTTEPTEATE